MLGSVGADEVPVNRFQLRKAATLRKTVSQLRRATLRAWVDLRIRRRWIESMLVVMMMSR